MLRMRLRVDREGSARPREVLAALGLADLEHEGFYLTRTARGGRSMTELTQSPRRSRLDSTRHRTLSRTMPNKKATHMKQEMLINVSQPEECRIAIVEDGVLEELYIERTSQDNYVGNIYKGTRRQPRAEHPGGVRRFRRRPQRLSAHQRRRAAVLPPGRLRSRASRSNPAVAAARATSTPARTSDDRTATRPATTKSEDVDEDGPRRTRGRTRGPRPGARPRIKPPIQDILRRGDEVLVQVIKEGIGTKGPTLSTYISIPGRYLVLMPALGRVGVSRKIEDDDARRKLRDIMLELNPPQGPGLHRPHRRHRPHQEGAVARPGLPAAAVEGDRPPHQEASRARSTSTKKAT